MDIEEEPAPFIIDGIPKIFLILDHLPLAANESTLLASADQVLQ
jgi:hypothetical protein